MSRFRGYDIPASEISVNPIKVLNNPITRNAASHTNTRDSCSWRVVRRLSEKGLEASLLAMASKGGRKEEKRGGSFMSVVVGNLRTFCQREKFGYPTLSITPARLFRISVVVVVAVFVVVVIVVALLGRGHVVKIRNPLTTPFLLLLYPPPPTPPLA